ncbi:phosphoethanolamine--lipid A transferase [Thermomonas brevis]
MDRLKQWWGATRRPLGSEWIALLAALFFTVACNAAFWRALAATPAWDGAAGWRLAAGLFFGMLALHAALLLVLLNRWTLKWLLPLILLVTASAVFYMTRYRVYIDPEMIRNVLATERKEAAELLAPGLMLTLLLYGVLPSILVWCLRPVRRSVARGLLVHAAGIALALLVAAAAIGLSYQPMAAFMRNEKPLRYLIAPGNWMAALAKVAMDDGGQREPKADIATDAVLQRPPAVRPRVLLLVVGETVRAQNWGLNGYARQTTPELAKLDGINYPDVTACGSNTEVSLPCMFSAQGLRGYDRREIRHSQSLLHLLDRLGIATLWRDNQTGCKGICSGLPFESFLDAAIPGDCNAERCLDQVLLRDLKARIEALPGDAVVVLHMLGNHGPAYYKRYPPEFRRFTPTCDTDQLGDCSRDAIVNAYDNSILYADTVVADAVRLLESLAPGRDTALLYLSDHGESLGEGGLYLHGVPRAIAPDNQLKVPMWLWLSPQLRAADGIDQGCLRERSSNPRTHDAMFSTVLGLMRVRSTARNPELDLMHGCRTGG